MVALWICPSWVLYCYNETVSKYNLGGKGLIWLTHLHQRPSLKEVKAGTLAGAEVGRIKECCLPACSLEFAQLAFLHISGAPAHG